MFKEKSTKKRLPVPSSAKDCSTLDAQHQLFIQNLQCQHDKLEDYKSQKALHQTELEYWTNFINNATDTDSDEYNSAWTSNLEIIEKLKQIDISINRQESCEDEIEYFQNTANILFQYYNLLENQNVDNAPTQTISMLPTRATKGRKKLLPVSSRSILDALSGADMVEQNDSAVVTQGLDKATLVEEYLSAIDPNHVPKKQVEPMGLCEECDSQLICLQQDGVMVCANCGYQELLLVEQNRPILRQPTKETSHFSYKRINHFNFGVKQQTLKACNLLVARAA